MEMTLPFDLVGNKDRTNFRKIWVYFLRHWRSITIQFTNYGTDDYFCKYIGRHGRWLKSGETVEDVLYLGKCYKHAIEKWNQMVIDANSERFTAPAETTPDESQTEPATEPTNGEDTP